LTGGVLFLVPARGGSRRIPGKNLRLLAGMPLAGRAVRTAVRAATTIPGGPHAVVCTTDDPAIADVAALWGAEVPFVRPAELATDAATSVDAAIHALAELRSRGREFRALVLVQPTSGLIEPRDLEAAIARFDGSGGRPIVGVAESHPVSWHHTAEADGSLVPATGPASPLLLTGGVYVIGPDELLEARRFVVPGRTIGLEIPAERSVDVDEEADMAVAEALLAARPLRAVPVGDRSIGDGPCWVIAEAGVNHDGDPVLAHRLVDAAAEARADAIKFQTFHPAALAATGAPLAEYQRQAGEGRSSQRQMLERLALPEEAWPGLRDHALERGLVFLSTPFDDASAELLVRVGVPAIKVASGDLTNLPFLDRLARHRLPLLVSTGMADMREVAAAVDAIAAAGDPPLALLHCVSSYPTAPADANLQAIPTLRRAFAVPAGWSDHTVDVDIPAAAVALGASIVEKHLTLDRSLPGPDHGASLEPGEFRAMVDAIRTIEAALGSGDKRPTAGELAMARVARRSLHWARDLRQGSVIDPADVEAIRPATGLAPGRLPDLVGRRVTRNVRAGETVQADDIEVSS
jgi:N,N'-diacetyllegionaminate synthase